MDSPHHEGPVGNKLKRFLDDHVKRLNCDGVADIFASESWVTRGVWVVFFGTALAFVITGLTGIINDYLDQTIITTYTYVAENE